MCVVAVCCYCLQCLVLISEQLPIRYRKKHQGQIQMSCKSNLYRAYCWARKLFTMIVFGLFSLEPLWSFDVVTVSPGEFILKGDSMAGRLGWMKSEHCLCEATSTILWLTCVSAARQGVCVFSLAQTQCCCNDFTVTLLWVVFSSPIIRIIHPLFHCFIYLPHHTSIQAWPPPTSKQWHLCCVVAGSCVW